ncbi:MAG: triose-phosphate isomerase [Rhodospirillaceae bacterium]|nr:triose-phosphate isomerase [Rhodospirillaceae bacterium]
MSVIRPLIAGNWKMNGLRLAAVSLAQDLVQRSAGKDLRCDVVICPPFTVLQAVAAVLDGSGIGLGGQDCHETKSGAFTGSISAGMLKDVGCQHVIVGHSERRHGLGETDAMVLAKTSAALAAGLVPVVCVGETLEEREAGAASAVVGRQIAASVPSVAGSMIVAYEPVWAIGTGKTASTDDIAAMHATIRSCLADLRPDGETIPIQYGGSAKPDNAAEILGVENVGGLLVGGASLDAEAFWEIVRISG